jgi:hypothetical protein
MKIYLKTHIASKQLSPLALIRWKLADFQNRTAFVEFLNRAGHGSESPRGAAVHGRCDQLVAGASLTGLEELAVRTRSSAARCHQLVAWALFSIHPLLSVLISQRNSSSLRPQKNNRHFLSAALVDWKR